jgi:hypothetical protein
MVVAVGTVVTGLTALASNEAVQAGAVRLAKDVYSRIMPGRAAVTNAEKGGAVGVPLAIVESGVTRDEMIAAVAMLQTQIHEGIVSATSAAEQDAYRRQRVLMVGLAIVGLLQLILLGVMVTG